jgi:type VI secretion system secreted protein Hcp
MYNVFLKIDGVEGESKDATHMDEIELAGWGWGDWGDGEASRGNSGGGPSSSGLSGLYGTSGLGEYYVMTVTKYPDKSSSKLLNAYALGTHFDALLTERKEGQNPVEFLKIKMSDVMITSFQAGSDDTWPTEKLTLGFRLLDINTAKH